MCFVCVCVCSIYIYIYGSSATQDLTLIRGKMGIVFICIFIKWFSVFCLRFTVILFLYLCVIIGFTLIYLLAAQMGCALKITSCNVLTITILTPFHLLKNKHTENL